MNISRIFSKTTAGALVVLMGIGFTVSSCSTNEKTEEQKEDAKDRQIEQLKLENEQLQLENEFKSINQEFEMYEGQAQMIQNDTIYAKYTAAKNRIEELQKELKASKGDLKESKKKIADLQKEIDTLRGLLRHYVAMIDSLNKENEGLKAENSEIRNRNEMLNSQVADVRQRNEVLNERMTLAEKLNVTGVSLTALKKNGKTEKNITKATQLMVTFTIPQNNSTPVGEKTIYMRLVSPEGQLLGNGGSFSFEGASVPCTARKTIEYSGDEISGIRIYWDVNATLNPGQYTVELFADNYMLAKRSFTMNK